MVRPHLPGRAAQAIAIVATGRWAYSWTPRTRTGAAGPSTSISAIAFPGFPVFVSTVAKRPTAGRFATYTSGQPTAPKS